MINPRKLGLVKLGSWIIKRAIYFDFTDEEKEKALKGLSMIAEAAARGAVDGAVNRK